MISAAMSAMRINSCRDRHCPKCQSLARAQWIENRQTELLEVPYFHVVFTIPEEIAAIALQNKTVVYSILFRATAETLTTIAADPKHLGAEIGFFAVLHSWGQSLQFHPHLHCVVPGGGPSPDGQRWVSCLPGFFLPVRVLSRLFRRLFLKYLQESVRCRQAAVLWLHWNRFGIVPHLPGIWTARRTPSGSCMPNARSPDLQQVLDYVGRYTHRVAITNNRILDIENDQVRFQWKDYRHGDQGQNHDSVCRRIHPAFPPPCTAKRVPAHSLLRIPRQVETGKEKLSHCRRLLGMPPDQAVPPTMRTGLPGPLRGTDRLFFTTVSPMSTRLHGAGRHTAEIYLQFPGNHGLLMIPLTPIRTRRQSRWLFASVEGSPARNLS